MRAGGYDREARRLNERHRLRPEHKDYLRLNFPDEDPEDDDHGETCAVCTEGGELLMCEDCPRVFHRFCLEPPLEKVPKDEWWVAS